jgi:diaminopimelate decarboxylase
MIHPPELAHPTVELFEVAGGVLNVGGVPVNRLASRVGSTPFFAYDRALITRRVSELRAELPLSVELSYAIKANPMPAVVQHISNLVDGLDVASTREMHTALDTSIDASRVSFAGPGKTVTELTQAVAAGVIIELESETEAERVIAVGNILGLRPAVAVRVNPDFEVKGSGMRLGGGPQQFGIDAERVPALLKHLLAADLDVLGFHVFPGSQNLQADMLGEAQRNTVELAIRLADEASMSIQYLNLGGGFGIPYTARDRPLDLAQIGRTLRTIVSELIEPNFPNARSVIELGRYIVGESGVYVTRVVDRKESRGELFLVVDGGLHHQLAASGNFGQVIRRNYPVTLVERMDEGLTETVTIVGCLCTPLDLLAQKISVPAGGGPGDLVAIFLAGAYGLTASPTAFLSHPTPIEVLI